MATLFQSLVHTSLRASPIIKANVQPVYLRSFSTCFNPHQQLQQQPQQVQETAIDIQPEAPVRSTLKPLTSRKTYLMDVYQHFWENNEIVLFTHHNNLLASDNEKIRKQLHKSGAEFRKLKSSIFRHYLRASNHSDPASKAASRQVKRNRIRHPLEPLLKGPTAAILIKDLNPKVVKEVLQVLKTQNEKLFLIGGRIGKDIAQIDEVKKFQDLPTLPELHSQLAGILTMLSGAGLVKTLESASNVLYLTLDSHRQEIEKPAEEKDAPVEEAETAESK